jgi:hypothetical protein
MDSHNISVCVAPSIFHKLDRPSDVESSFQAIAFIEYLINNCGKLFGSDLFLLLNAAKLMKKKDEQTITSSLSSFSSENLIAESAPSLPKQIPTPLPPPTTPTTTTTTTTINNEDKTKQNKPIKHKREIGRMLNLVSLKGRKSLSSNTGKLNNEKTNNITTTPELETQVQQIENESKPAMLIINSSIENLTNGQPTTTGSKLRRRTSTNNSNDQDCFEFNNDDEEEEEDYDENIFDFNENKNDDDDDDDYEEECFDDLINHHQYSRRKSNHKRNINSIKIKYKPNNLNNAVINKQHDLSSNTLSVDSGLSVPTATNSDPESEKSAKICDKNFEEKLKKEIENYFVSNETLTINTSQSTQNNNNNLLKRQRRMLVLKIDSDETNTNNESTDNFEEIQFTYDPNSKPIAPIAPTNTNDNTNHVLIPYNTDTLPLHYHKNLEQDQENEMIINSFNNKKRIAPTVHDLINQSSVLTLSKLDNFDNLITSNMTLNKSTSTTTTTTTTTTDLKIKSKTNQNNKTLVKIDFSLNNLNKNNINNAINTGIGLVKMNEIDYFSLNDKPWV